MKIYLKSAVDLVSDVLFEAKILINIELNNIEDHIIASQIVRFLGADSFRQALATILKSEYHFDIIPSDAGTEGQISDRPDSESVYFNTYYDLAESDLVLKRLGISSIHSPESGKVHCFIHFRFSGHPLEDVGDIAHNKFLNDNVNKHIKNHPTINHVEREVEVQVPQKDLFYYYNDALEDIRYELDGHIAGWVRKVYQKYPELF